MQNHARKEPLRVDAQHVGGEAAAIIFLHGYGDDADGFVSEYSLHPSSAAAL
jgi:predicted esterase